MSETLSEYSYPGFYCDCCCWDGWLEDEEYEEDQFVLSKSRNQIAQRKIVKNKSAHLGMAHLKTDYNVVKMLHSQKDNEFSEISDKTYNQYYDDLTPFVVYSMNKRNRWDIEWNDELFCNLERTNRTSANIFVLERVNLKTFNWKHCPWVRITHEFLINKLHYRNESKDQIKLQLNSIYGQCFSHFLHKTSLDKSEPIVSYNFIKAPDNYLTLGEQYFVDSNYGKKVPYYAHTKRVEQLKEDQFDIRKDLESFKFFDELMFDYFEDVDFDITKNGYRTHYDLTEHVLMDFVLVKRPAKKLAKKRREQI